MSTNSHLSLKALFGIEGLVARKAVYIIGGRQETLDNAAKQGTKGSIIPIQGYVTSKEDLTRIAERIKNEQGYINVLFANSGVVGVQAAKQGLPTDRKPSVQGFVDAMWKPSMEDFNLAAHVNVTGAFYSALAFLPLLDACNQRSDAQTTPKSSIMVTSSIAGFSRSLAAGFACSSSKAGVTHLVKMLSTYFADYKIRVNAIAPGMFASEMTSGMEQMAGGNGNKVDEEGGLDRKFCPMERSGREEEMAGTAVYLASRAGAYLKGNVVVMDGGRLGELPACY